MLALCIGLAGYVVVRPEQAHAAPIIYYELNTTDGTCEPGDTVLITPYIRNGKSYYCARRPEGAATYTAVTTNPPSCPSGQPMFNDPLYGYLCISKYTGGTPKWGTSPGAASSTDPIGITPPVNLTADCDPENGEQLNSSNCAIYGYLLTFINVLSGIVGIVVVLMIITGGIQYASSADDPQKVTAAKKRIFNAIFAIVAYIFLYAFLQWIVPGGVF